jgi:hypothetical protein
MPMAERESQRLTAPLLYSVRESKRLLGDLGHDTAGTRAAAACGARWRDAGREAILIEPLERRADLNDLIRG